MSHRARPLRPARRLLPALAVGGVAALAVAAPAMATLPPGGVNENYPAQVELTGQINGKPVGIIIAQEFNTSFLPARKRGTFHNTATGLPSIFGTAVYRQRTGRLRLTLRELVVLTDFVPQNAGAGNQAVPARAVVAAKAPIVFPELPVDGAVPNAPQTNIPRDALRNNHYKCYDVLRVDDRPETDARISQIVDLSDAFGDKTTAPSNPDEVCIPVVKGIPGRRVTDIRDTRPSLVRYVNLGRGGFPPDHARRVTVRNQFDDGPLTRNNLWGMLVPSRLVNIFRGGRQPQAPRTDRVAARPDFFACYSLTGAKPAQPRRVLGLRDRFERRFHRGRTTLHDLCSPVDAHHSKSVGLGRLVARHQTRWRMQHPQAHLTSYTLPGRAQQRTRRVVVLQNKFGRWEVVTGNFTRILVPSAMRICARFTAKNLGIPVIPVGGGTPVGTIDTVTFTPWAGQGACAPT